MSESTENKTRNAQLLPDSTGREHIIELKDVNKSYDGTQVLHDITFYIRNNEFVTLLGPSGCGKSTLLRTFNRLNDNIEGLRMTGEVTFDGTNILRAGSSRLSELRRNIGLVPQRPCPLPMSIYDNVAYGCRIHGIHNRHQQNKIVRHYLRAVGLWDEVKDRLAPWDCGTRSRTDSTLRHHA